MKTYYKVLILVLSSYIPINSYAEDWYFSTFASDTSQDDCCADFKVGGQPDLAAGVSLSVESSGKYYWGGDVFLHNYRPGVDLKIGTKTDFGNFSAGFGKYAVYVEKEKVVSGVKGSTNYSGYSDLLFIEYEYQRFFLRYSRIEYDADFHYSVLTAPSTTVQDSESVALEDDWLWAGYKFKF